MKWFYTPNKQIINLENFNCFWIEQVSDFINFHIFAQDKSGTDWRIGEFDTLETAEDWLHRVDTHLHQDNSKDEDELENCKVFLRESQMIDVILKIKDACDELREIINI